MEFMIHVINASVYARTGEEAGRWFNLPCENLVEELAIMGCTPTDNYIIIDAETPFGYEVDEYARLDYLNELAATLEDVEHDFEWIASFMEATGYSLEAALERYEEHSVFYSGMDMQDVAQNLVEENIELPSWLENYIDYEKLADSLEYEDYYETEYGVVQLF